MPFDPSTAKLEAGSSAFDPATAKPVDAAPPDNRTDTPTVDASGAPAAPITGGPDAKLLPPVHSPEATKSRASIGKMGLIDPILTHFGTREKPSVGEMLGATDAFAGLGGGVSAAKTAGAPIVQGAAKALGKGATLAGEGISHALGVTTGAGASAIQEASKAGYEGGQSAKLFLDNLRKKVPLSDVVQSAKDAVASMGRQAGAAYQSGMAKIKSDASQLKFDDIDAAITKASAIGNYHGKVINEAADKAVNTIADAVREWKAAAPDKFHTPEGFDQLKRLVGGELDKLGYEEKTARHAVNEVYNAVKSTIQKQSPGYADVMKQYGEAQEALRELESSLSLKKQGLIDPALRKLQSIMRNNVNTNYGNRADMVKSLEEQGGKSLRPSLAGQALNSMSPRSLSGQGAGIMSGAAALGQAAQGNLVPAAIAAGTIPLESPRLVGEGAYYAGKIGRKFSDVFNPPNPLNP